MAIAPSSTHPVERIAQDHHRALTVFLRSTFGTSLSEHDCNDVIAETYSQALGDPKTADYDLNAMRAWTYRLARNRAVDVIRQRERRNNNQGDDASYDVLADSGFDIVDNDASAIDSLDNQALAENTLQLHAALNELSEHERQVVQYVTFDQLSLRATGDLLNMDKNKVQRLHAKGIARLVKSCSKAHSSDCKKARSLLRVDKHLTMDLLGWRDAHLAGCMSCQLIDGRRVPVLVPLLPLAMPGRFSQLSAQLLEFFGRNQTLNPETATASGATLAGTSVAASGATTGSLISSAAATKVAACASAGAIAVTCIGIATPAITNDKPRKSQRSDASTRQVARPTSTATTSPTLPLAVTAPTPERQPRSASQSTTERKPATRRVFKPRRQPTTSSAGEFSPESNTPAPAPTPVPLSESASVTSSDPAPLPSRTSSQPSDSSSSFSNEFAP